MVSLMPPQETEKLTRFATAAVMIASEVKGACLRARCPLYPQKRILRSATGMSALCQKQTLRYSIAMLFPLCFGKGIERNLQISTAIVFWRWQPASRNVHLQGGQHQSRQQQGSIPLLPKLDEFGLVAIP